MIGQKLTAILLLTSTALPLSAQAENTTEKMLPQSSAGQSTQNEYEAHSAIRNTAIAPIPAVATVITSAEMKDHRYQSVAEALQYAPGVTVTPGSFNTGHPVVRIDGDDRVAVFIDGRKQNLESGFTDGRATYDLDLTPPVSIIDRIEVIHGAAGDIFWSAETPGGVINIITKRGQQHRFSFEGARGTHNAWRWDTCLEGSGKGWSWIAAGGRSDQGPLHYKSFDGENGTMPNSRRNRREMYYRFDRQLTDHSSLSISYGHFSNDTGLWYSRYFKPLHKEYHDYNYEKLANDVSVTYNYKENKEAPAYISLYHNYNQGDTYRPTGTKEQKLLPSYSRWKTDTDGLDWRDGWRTGKHRMLTAGLTVRHTSVKNDANYDVKTDPVDEANRSYGKNYAKSMTTTSFFLKSSHQFKKLFYTSTKTLTHNSIFGNKYLSNRVAEYRPDNKTSFYGGLQKIFAVPTLDELYYDNAKIEGNPSLEPEKGWKLSGGLRHRFSQKVSGDLGGFLTYTKNPILWGKSTGKWRPFNGEGSHQQGLRFSLTDAFSDKYSSHLAYTFTHSRVKWGAENPVYTEEVAPHLLQAALRYKDARWANNLLLTAGLGRDSEWYSGDYFLVDANVNYTFNKHWSSYLKLRNLLNADYEILGSRNEGEFPGRGRTMLLGVTYSY